MAYVTTVRVPEELAEAVKVYCARTGATMNGAVVVALERLVSDSALAGRVGEPTRVPEPVSSGGASGEGNGPASPPRPVSASNQVTPDWRGGKP